jgi:glycosyltransferase involved in cell wall biosynthesis
MMRISMLVPPDALAGRVRVAAAYASRLARRGHRVTVIQPRPPHGGIRGRLWHLCRTARWPRIADAGPSYFDPGSPSHGPAERWTAPIKRRILSHPGPLRPHDLDDGDIVLATWWEAAQWAWSLPRSRGFKVHLVHDYEIWAGNVARVDAAYQLPIPKIVSARWVANLLSSRFGQEPVALIPSGVDTSLFQAPPRGKQRVPTVGLTYNASPNKGIDISIAAVELARKEIPNLKFLAFGSQTQAARAPLPPNTDYFHRLPDRELAPLYASCDAWLWGTRIQGFGLPILEAMACRTPVIGTPAGAAPDLLAHGGGIQVPMEDPLAMAQAIVRLALLPDRRWREMSEAAFQTANSYTWDDATDRLEAALEQIRTGTCGCLLQTPAARPMLRDAVIREGNSSL